MADTLETLDTAAIAAEIGSDLFGGGGDNGLDDDNDNFAANPPAELPPELGKTAPVAPENTLGITPAQIKSLPKSWKKEMEPLWAKADPALHDYVYNREADVMRGLQQYQEGYQTWQKLMQPYVGVFQQHPNVQPVAVMQALMNTHLQLLSAEPAKKVEIAKRILSEYGIDLSGEGQTPAVQRDPAVYEIQRELAQLKDERLKEQKRIYDEGVAAQLTIVQAFAKDPKNVHFSAVENDIFRFLQTGAATDLAAAYELACYANPAIRAKIIAEQSAPSATPSAAAKFPNLDENSTGKPRRQRAATMDDTINAIVQKHYSSH